MAQLNLGVAYTDLPTGDREENLRRAIACYEAALRVYTETAFPLEWAVVQNDLGVAHSYLPDGDREENLNRAIACFEAALRVYTEADFPEDWADTQNNLGDAYRDLPGGDRAENVRKAIPCHEAALRVHTEAALPAQWAETQHDLALSLLALGEITDDPDALRRAREHCVAALRGFATVGLDHKSTVGNATLARIDAALTTHAT
jgi:tetratricopeptide (TPR) repeat protein